MTANKDFDAKKTGTTTVGIKCKDCVILAADKRATTGNFVADKKIMKVIKINDRMATTVAGTVSDVQLLTKYLAAEVKIKDLRSLARTTVKEAANLMAQFVYSNIRKPAMIVGVTHFLFAGYDNEGVHLFDIFPDGTITAIEDFVSSGSGSMLAYGVLENSFKKDMTTEEGTQLALRALNAALQRDSASGNGVDVMVISGTSAEFTVQKLVNTGIQ